MTNDEAPATDECKALYDAGRQCLESGDTTGAIERLERSAKIYPHFKTLELLGEAWLRSGTPLNAIVPLAAATTLNRQARAVALLSEALLAIGQQIQAHEMSKVALERGPSNRRAKAVFEATLGAYNAWRGDSQAGKPT